MHLRFAYPYTFYMHSYNDFSHQPNLIVLRVHDPSEGCRDPEITLLLVIPLTKPKHMQGFVGLLIVMT